MFSLNKVQLIGYVGKEPADVNFNNGGKLVTLSIATSEGWKDKASGEFKNKTEWHNVIVTNTHLIDFVKERVRKGDFVYIEGEIQTRTWSDKNSREHKIVEIAIKPFKGNIMILSDKKPLPDTTEKKNIFTKSDHKRASFNDLDDEIPF